MIEWLSKQLSFLMFNNSCICFLVEPAIIFYVNKSSLINSSYAVLSDQEADKN